MSLDDRHHVRAQIFHELRPVIRAALASLVFLFIVRRRRLVRLEALALFLLSTSRLVLHKSLVDKVPERTRHRRHAVEIKHVCDHFGRSRKPVALEQRTSAQLNNSKNLVRILANLLRNAPSGRTNFLRRTTHLLFSATASSHLSLQSLDR